MIRVADYIISFLYDLGVNHIFTVTGGGAMFLNDAIAAHKKIAYVCNHHEQASVMAADTYSRITENFGAAVVTSGPGATNAVTGVVEAWQDSTPLMVVSGQSKRQQTVYNSKIKGLRQFGFLEANIIPIIKSVTKYSVMINDPNSIKYHLEKAVYLSKSGRPGPVWLDVPLDVQGAFVDEKKLIGFKEPKNETKLQDKKLRKQIDFVYNMLLTAKRPVVIAGGGIRLAGATEEFLELIEYLKIPVVSSIMGSDLVEDENPFFIGRAGMRGERAANIAIQNSDLILSVGSRLSVPIIGYEYEKFAPEAKKIVVDIDEVEHKKVTIKIDLIVICDAKKFIKTVMEKAKSTTSIRRADWAKKLKGLRSNFPVYLKQYGRPNGPVNMYSVVEQVSTNLGNSDIVVTDAGYSYYIVRQAITIKKGQRLIIPGATGAMGFNLPASIGASLGSRGGRVICITGDGSLQTNVHELQTISHNNLPIKIFVLNNKGYLSIRNTQMIYFKDRLIGESKNTGLSLPECSNLATTYGIKFYQAKDNRELARIIPKVLNFDGPVICEVNCLEQQQIMPTVTSKQRADGTFESASIDDMYPFLAKKEMDNIKSDLHNEKA